MKQSNFKESRLKAFKNKYIRLCDYRGDKEYKDIHNEIEQFLSETIDMAEKNFEDIDKLSEDITDIFYFETSKGSWKFTSRKEMVKNLILKSLSPKE